MFIFISIFCIKPSKKEKTKRKKIRNKINKKKTETKEFHRAKYKQITSKEIIN